MRQGFDHSPGGAAEQLCIGVQRDDKSNALELSTIARAEKSFQLGRGFASEESIELLQLATLALPADPAFLAPAGDDVDILRVLGHVLPRCIGKIAQETESQICIGIAKVANLESVELALDSVNS